MTPKPRHLRRLRPAEVPPADGAPPAGTARRPLALGALHGLLPIAIGALWALQINRIDLRDMTDLGLISVMPASALLLLALLTASFCLTLRAGRMQPWVAFIHIAVLILMLYGVSVFLDPSARTAPVYRHVGIIDHIIRHGSVDPNIDAYFNWPGFFALGAVITEAAGIDSALELAPWAPLVFNFLYLPPLLVIFRWATDDQRVWWLGLWIFYSANWVGQDYLSPQTISFTLSLAILAALLTWFTPRPAQLGSGLRRIRARLRDQREANERKTPHRRAAGIVLMVVAIFAAMVTGHQLTPFAALLGVAGLVIFAGLQTRRLPITMAILLGAWISYQTTPYLIGHIESLTGPLGSTSDNLNKNVSGRVGGSDDHVFIVNVRLVGSALIWLLAVAGLARRYRAQRVDVAFVVLWASPLLLPIIQPYGGEMVLRVFVFTLPVVAFFIASLAFPSRDDGRSWPAIAAVALLCFVLLGLFQFMRYGNERLDYFTEGDTATVSAMYDIAKPGATVYGAGNTPWKYRAYTDYDYRSIVDLRTWKLVKKPKAAAIVAEMARRIPPAGAYVMVTRSMRIHAQLLVGKPGVLEEVVRLLRASPRARQVYAGADGIIFRLRYSPASPAARRLSASERRAVARQRSAAAAADRARARARARARQRARPAAPAVRRPSPGVAPPPVVPLRPPPQAAPRRPAPPPPPPPSNEIPFDDIG